jgi:iron complex transport system substrate-binding protein
LKKSGSSDIGTEEVILEYARKLIFMFVLTMVLIACSGPAVAEAPAAEPTDAPTSEIPTDVPPTSTMPAEPITVVDALGNEITFEKLPERIAIAGRATALIAHSMYMFPEAIDRLAAVEDRVQRDLSFYRVVDPSFDDKLLLERNAGPEQIIPSNPDVVLMKSYLAESLGEPIEQLGIPVIYLDLETPEQFERDIAVIGKLLGNSARAEQIISFYSDRSQQIASVIAAIPEAEYPDVLLMQYSDRGGEIAFNVPSGEWLQTSMIELAGGNPVWLDAAEGGGWTIVGFEQIAAWDPEVVFVIYYFSDPTPIVESLKEDANWQQLQATQNNELYAFPGDFLSWDQPDPRWILGLTWLTTTLHPEESDSINFQAEIMTFYQEMYGLSTESIESEIMPRLSPWIE